MEPGCKAQPLKMEPNKKRFVSLVAMVLLNLSVSAAGGAVDSVGVPGPISINQLNYDLAWSSHPKDNFYIQEYVQAGKALVGRHPLILPPGHERLGVREHTCLSRRSRVQPVELCSSIGSTSAE